MRGEHLHAAVLGSLIEGGFEDAARQVLEQKTRVAVAILLPRGVGLLRGERGGGRAQDTRSIRDPGFDSDAGRLGAAFALECGFGE